MTAESGVDGEPAAEPEPPMSWAEVYAPADCGGCGNADCPCCINRFLQFLAANGTKPLGGG